MGSFVRVLGRLDLVLFSVSAILTVDTLASAASMGVTWFTWWIIIMALFFVPYGLVTAELGAAWPAEGGLYVWVREGLGPRWGSAAAWFYWISNVYWVPSIMMIFAGTIHAIFLAGSVEEGPGLIWLQAGIAVAATWLTVALGVLRLEVAKWIPNLGALVKTAILVTLGVLGLLSLRGGGAPANSFDPSGLIPVWSDSLAYLPVLLFNTLGFELMSSAGDEMRDPQRDVPITVLLSGVVICVAYMLGVAGILLAVPVADLSVLTGTWDALAHLCRAWGGAGELLGLALGLGFLYTCLGNVVTWSLGANRVAAAAAAEGTLPARLGTLHSTHNTPWVALVSMGVVATGILLLNAALGALWGAGEDAVFWMVFKLQGLIFLLPYALLFPAFVALRIRRPDHHRPYRVPGGTIGGAAAAGICWVFIAGSCVLYFKPAPGGDVRESWLIAGEALLTLLVGLLLVPRRGGRGS